LRHIWRSVLLPPAIRRAVTPAVRLAVTAANEVRAMRAPPPTPIDQVRVGPVSLAGFHNSVIGLGMAARLNRTTLDQLGFEVDAVDLSPMINQQDFGRKDFGVAQHVMGKVDGGVLLLHVNPPELGHALAWLGAGMTRNVYRVGYWAWSLPVIPSLWARHLRHFHEIWVPTSFVADAIKSRVPPNRPIDVRIVPLPVPPMPDVRPNRAAFGLPESACVVLTMFDMRSSMARKNPLGASAAFRQACGDDPRACLLIKVSHPEIATDQFARLRRAAGCSNVRILTEILDDEKSYSLTACADIIRSLHRAEGFGLVMAEAMRLGKAIVATNWSGNIDFMTKDTAALVDYDIVDVDDPQGNYRGQKWADARITHAAALLKGLVDDRSRRAMMGARARELADECFSAARFKANLSPNFLRFAARRPVSTL
jgi:glycosyltransferase involved in cell wall biosynthesis